MKQLNKLTGAQINAVRTLLNAIIETEGQFHVIPPLKPRRILMILAAADWREQLDESQWVVAFRDGRNSVLAFSTVMVVLYNYRRLRRYMSDAKAREKGAFRLALSLDRIMLRSTIARLFTKMVIEPPPSPPAVTEIALIDIEPTKLSRERVAQLIPIPGLDGHISNAELHRITDLVELAIVTPCEFKIFPPREVVDDPDVLSAPDVSARLLQTKWWLVFDNGREELLTFSELLVMTHQLVELERQIKEARAKMEAAGSEQAGILVKVNFNLIELLQPDSARYLLGRLRMDGME